MQTEELRQDLESFGPLGRILVILEAIEKTQRSILTQITQLRKDMDANTQAVQRIGNAIQSITQHADAAIAAANAMRDSLQGQVTLDEQQLTDLRAQLDAITNPLEQLADQAETAAGHFDDLDTSNDTPPEPTPTP
jgi:chromosome segregation ATPase